ncbi:Serine/threonine-protein kinase CTR1 [Platanthera guangdongensis]|uniref:Serine/threonine-protein kinase CTR1 n=1 Tax=Platanthera guangdongensis TaxID=2320717 RepID=A0ABR2ME05_9ASPA
MAAAAVAQNKPAIRRQCSTGSIKRCGRLSFRRQLSFDHKLNEAIRFSFGRQSSMDPNRRIRSPKDEHTVPENLDCTMQLLFMACTGDADGVDVLLKEGIDVNSIDLDGRTALHIAACEGHMDVVKLLLNWKVNIDARDRWGSTAAADAKFYGHTEVFNILKVRGARAPKIRKTPMAVSNPGEVPEYELNPGELQFRRGEEVLKGKYQVAKWNGTKVSVKILDKERYSDPDSINAFKHELTLLEKVRHPNVVQFVGAVTQNIPMMIVSEYHPKGDLRGYLQKRGRLQLHKSLRFSLDIARRNILLDNVGQLKVAGFGLIKLSKVSTDKFRLAHPRDDIFNLSIYSAPEICRNEIFDASVDTYSFGVILYEMIEGAQPFHNKTREDAVRLICLEGKRPQLKYKSKGYPSELKELIEECWDPEPLIRPSFSEIIVRLDKLDAQCDKGQWKDTFKLPWYVIILHKFVRLTFLALSLRVHFDKFLAYPCSFRDLSQDVEVG